MAASRGKRNEGLANIRPSVCVCPVFTHGCIAAGVGRAFSLSVCPRSKRKTDLAIDIKLCIRILYSSRSVGIDPEVKSLKVKVTWI